MWLFVIILFGWLGWKMFNFSFEYILPIALIILAVMYALKFWWLVLVSSKKIIINRFEHKNEPQLLS